MIKVKAVKKYFGGIATLNGVTLQVKKNELLSIVGPSGCGKTTLLNIIAGLVQPDYGEVFIDEVLVSGKQGNRMIYVNPSQRKVGYVFQNYSLFPHMKVRENVSYGLKANHLPKHEVETRTFSLLDFVKLREYSEYYPHQLSGGQKQRVALARSLATNPKVLLLDEPLSSLDAKLRETMRAEFKNLLKTLETTTIYVTHDLAEACIMSDRIAVMGKGRIEQVGSRDQILKPNSKFVADFLGLNVYNGKLVHNSPTLAKIEIEGIEILAPSTEYTNGETVLVTIEPEAIILSAEPIINSHKWCGCTCNILLGTIVEIVEMKSIAKVIADVGFLIKSELTVSSLKELNLVEGKKAYVQFKADSLSISKEA